MELWDDTVGDVHPPGADGLLAHLKGNFWIPWDYMNVAEGLLCKSEPESAYDMKLQYLHDEGVLPFDARTKVPDVVMPFASCGWIVGGGARHLLGIDPPPKDWDIIVPWSQWNWVRDFIPEGSPSSRMGGFKFQVGGVEIDLWPMDLGDFLRGLEGKSEGCPCVDITSRLVVAAHRGFSQVKVPKS